MHCFNRRGEPPSMCIYWFYVRTGVFAFQVSLGIYNYFYMSICILFIYIYAYAYVCSVYDIFCHPYSSILILSTSETHNIFQVLGFSLCITVFRVLRSWVYWAILKLLAGGSSWSCIYARPTHCSKYTCFCLPLRWLLGFLFVLRREKRVFIIVHQY